MYVAPRTRADLETLRDGLKPESSGTEGSRLEALEPPLPLPRFMVLMGGEDVGGEKRRGASELCIYEKLRQLVIK